MQSVVDFIDQHPELEEYFRRLLSKENQRLLNILQNPKKGDTFALGDMFKSLDRKLRTGYVENLLQKLTREVFENWHFEGNLDLRDTPITSLGELQSVGGYLYLDGTLITSLGRLQSVGGYLNLYGTPITRLGRLQNVGGYLNLKGTPITSLGRLQSVGGNLYLQNTQITSLGKLQSVGGDLYLYGTRVPPVKNIKIGGIVYR
jgi:hypothetical protein